MSRKPVAISAEQFLAQAVGTCNNCRHWFNNGEELGECRRYPPGLIIGVDEDENEFPMAMWPSSAPDDFCGEHRGNA